MTEPVTRSSKDGGFTQWPNEFWDQLGLTLDPVDTVVFAHFYRLASIDSPDMPLGYCKVSLPRLAARVNCQLTRLRNSLARLEARQLVERISVDVESSNVNERGVVWRVNYVFVSSTAPVPQRDRSRAETGSVATPMKENPKDSEKDSDLSLMAVRIVDSAMRNGEGKPTVAELERELRQALAITGQSARFSDVELIAIATKWGREEDS